MIGFIFGELNRCFSYFEAHEFLFTTSKPLYITIHSTMKKFNSSPNKTSSSLLIVPLLFCFFSGKVTAQEISILGTYTNQKPEFPNTLKIGKKDIPVTWDQTNERNFGINFEKVEVNGTVSLNGTKKQVKAIVWVLPENLVYLFDTGRANQKSEIFEAAKKLIGKGLLNDAPDRKVNSEKETWGYIERNNTNDQKVHVISGSPEDWATSFLGDDNDKDEGLSYRISLQPGTYKITAAHVPNSIGSFASWINIDKVKMSSKVIKTTVMQDSIHPPLFVSHDVRLTQPKTFTYETQKTSGYPNANVSLIAVEKVGSNISLPIFSPTGGDFWQKQSVTLNHSTQAAEIYYTLDGSTPNKTSTRYQRPIEIDKTIRVNAIAYLNNEPSKVVSQDFAINNWAVTATPFKLEGENDVKNVKLNWEQRQDIDSYKIFRDSKLVGESKGNTFDDYGLESGNTYTYYIEGYKGDQKITVSTSHQATTFKPSEDSFIYNNSNGKNNIKRRGGFEIDNNYFSYEIREIEKNVDGKNAKGRAIFEKVSANGLDKWTERELGFFPNANFEGVGILYNKETKKIVIVAHYEDQGGYTAAKLYLGQVTPKGKLETTFCDRPLGFDSRDQSMFIDDDNTAYVLSATNTNEDVNIYKLDKTWSKPIQLVNTIFKGQHRETPYLVKKDGEYYFFSSKASGWYPSQAMYASATDLSGVWTQLKELGNNSTFGSQANSVFKFGTDKTTYGMYSYHWGAQYNQKDPDGNYPRLLFVNFNAGYASMEYYSKLEYNEKDGLIPVQSGRNLTMGRRVIATNSDSRNGGPENVTDGAAMNSSKFFKGTTLPYSLTIDLEKKARIKEINLSTKLMGGSETAYKYTIEASTDGKDFKTIVDNLNNWQVGFHILKIEDQTPYRYLKLNVSKIVNVHNNNGAEWADGIFELAAYGTPE